MGVLALVVAIALLIVLSFRGLSILIVAPLLAMGLMAVTGDMPAISALTGPFMKVTASYVQSYFPMFLGGAIFGKIMGETGAANSISIFISNKLGTERATLAVVLATALLTYGGVSLFVVVFAAYPLAVALYKEANLPKRLIPGALALGAFTFTMTALPGSPQFINSMPTNKLGTTIYAAPTLGIIAAIFVFAVGMMWLNYRNAEAKKLGEGFDDSVIKTNVNVDELEIDGVKASDAKSDNSNLPSVGLSFSPIILIFILNYVFVNIIFTAERKAYFKPFGGYDGNWPVTIALMVAIIFSIIVFKSRIKNLKTLINSGAESSIAPILNTAMIVGFGGVVKLTAAFVVLKDWVLGLNVTGLYKVFISTSIMAGITGSSSGGVGIALDALGDNFLAMKEISPEVIHRVMLIGAGGLDSLPHCGAVITLLAVCGMTHSKSYKDIGVVTVILPVFAALLVIILYNTFGII